MIVVESPDPGSMYLEWPDGLALNLSKQSKSISSLNV